MYQVALKNCWNLDLTFLLLHIVYVHLIVFNVRFFKLLINSAIFCLFPVYYFLNWQQKFKLNIDLFTGYEYK